MLIVSQIVHRYISYYSVVVSIIPGVLLNVFVITLITYFVHSMGQYKYYRGRTNFNTIHQMEIYLPLETQERVFLYIRIIFCFSSILHTIALTCLLKQTPPNQATVRNYLIYIQVTCNRQ